MIILKLDHQSSLGFNSVTSINLTEARCLMVASQIRRRGVKDKRVLAAMEAVPRHKFVTRKQKLFAYEDSPLPIGHKQTISQPYIVAYMTEQLMIEPEHTVLEIGTGCGYQAAILSELAQSVTSIEIVPELARDASARLKILGYNNVSVHHHDGRLGWPDDAPYNRIIVTAAPNRVPEALIEQLDKNGRMIVPVGYTRFSQKLEIVVKDRYDTVEYIPSLAVRFVPLI